MFRCPAETGLGPRIGSRPRSEGGLVFGDANIISSYMHLFGRGNAAPMSQYDYWHGWRDRTSKPNMPLPRLNYLGSRIVYRGSLGNRAFTMLSAEEQPLAFDGFSLDTNFTFRVPTPYNDGTVSLGSRPNIHLIDEGNNFLMADGHVVWRSYYNVVERQRLGLGTSIGLYW